MSNKKIIAVIVLFIVCSLFIFTFANPAGEQKIAGSGDKDNVTNSDNDNQKPDEENSNNDSEGKDQTNDNDSNGTGDTDSSNEENGESDGNDQNSENMNGGTTTIPGKQPISGNTGSGNGSTGTNNGNTGSGNGSTGTNNGNTGSGNGSTGTNNGNTGSGNGSTGTDNGNTGSGNGSTGTDNGNTGSGNGSTGTDNGNTGSGNGSTGTDNGNTGSGNGSTGTDNGNTGSGNGNTGTDNGNTGSGNGNTGSDNGNTGSGNGNTGTDNGNTDSGNGNTGTDNGTTDSGNTNPSEPDSTIPEVIGNANISVNVEKEDATTITRISSVQNDKVISLQGSITQKDAFVNSYSIDIKFEAPTILNQETLTNFKYHIGENYYGISSRVISGISNIDNKDKIATEKAYFTIQGLVFQEDITVSSATPLNVIVDWGNGEAITYAIDFRGISIIKRD